MSTSQAVDLMMDFARRTGLTSERAADRYLWTDAFAVCNFVGLARTTDQTRHMELASRLVDQVHHVLGRHRDDDPRQGWLSGLSEAEGEAHPTRAGLRIGKPLPERREGEHFDQRREWDRDGQYFHYLTKWMHALDIMTRAAGDSTFNRWGRELAQAAHRGFVYTATGQSRPRMYWKMSIDLTRPLVPSMGHHDPLDGYVSIAQLRSTVAQDPEAPDDPTLDDELDEFASMVEGRDWTTSDPLGLGGLLADVVRLDHLMRSGASGAQEDELMEAVVDAASRGLREYASSPGLELPARRRLAFRELGLAIGLSGVESMLERDDAAPELAELESHLPLRERIVSFWQQPEHREASTWAEHRNINTVMLATALAPEGFLGM